MMLIKTDVIEYMPDGLLEELEDLPSDEGRGRGRGRGRNDRSRGRERDRGEKRSRSRRERPDTAESPAGDTPVAEAEKPKRERKERPKRDYKRKDDDLILDPAPDEVKGFGDDVPAFLK